MLGPASVAGAHQAEHLVGVVGMGGPDLGAVEHIVLAVRFGPELQRSQVRAGTGLRVALAPVVLPGQDARKQLRLLRLGAVADQHGAAHAKAHRRQAGRLGGAGFQGPNVAAHQVPSRAAVLSRPAWSHPTLPMQDSMPANVVLVVQKDAWTQPLRLFQLFAQRGAQKDPHLLAEGFMFVAERNVQRHQLPPPGPSIMWRLGGEGKAALLPSESSMVPPLSVRALAAMLTPSASSGKPFH